MTIEKLLEKAQELNEEKKYSDVIELLTDKVLDKNNNAELYAEKAQAFYRINDVKECEVSVEKALLIDPLNVKANNYMGTVLFKYGKYEKAVEWYNKALKLDPFYSLSYQGLGASYNKLKEYKKAVECYKKVAEYNPSSSFPYRRLGGVYENLKDYDNAIEAYKKALEIDPYRADYNYSRLGSLYDDIKDYNNAITFYKKAIEINSENAYYHYGIGLVYNNLKDFNNAISSYDKAIQLDNKNANYYYALGLAYHNLKKYDKAVENYGKAISVDSQYVDAYYNRAVACFFMENYQSALIDFKKYVELTKLKPDYFTSIAIAKVAEINKLIRNADYSSINELVNKIKALLLFTDKCVTHYTSLSVTKVLILDNSKFRLSEGAYLNDTSEGRELFNFLPRVSVNNLKDSDTMARPFATKPFIGSFVAETKHDDLTLWRMYGKENKEEARGCAITIEREKFLETLKESLIPLDRAGVVEKINEEFSFYRVAYKKQGELEAFLIPGITQENENDLNVLMKDLFNKVKEYLHKKRKMSDRKNLLELLNGIAYLFKSGEYQYEHELRLVVKGTGILKQIDYKNFSPPRVYVELVNLNSLIRKITLGPKVDKAEEWASAFYYSLDEQDFHPEILVSHLPFK